MFLFFHMILNGMNTHMYFDDEKFRFLLDFLKLNEIFDA